jgi:hypothetical protein
MGVFLVTLFSFWSTREKYQFRRGYKYCKNNSRNLRRKFSLFL